MGRAQLCLWHGGLKWNHSLIIDEVLAHPCDVSWLPRPYNISFSSALPPALRCSHAFSTAAQKETADLGESDAANRPDSRRITGTLALTADLTLKAARGLALLCVSDAMVPDAVGALFYRCLPVFRSVVLWRSMLKRLTLKSYSVTKWLALGQRAVRHRSLVWLHRP